MNKTEKGLMIASPQKTPELEAKLITERRVMQRIPSNTVDNLHAIVDENFVHYLLYLVEIWSLIRVFHPALFHKFPDLLDSSYQLRNRWTERRELAFFHSTNDVYRNKDVKLK